MKSDMKHSKTIYSQTVNFLLSLFAALVTPYIFKDNFTHFSLSNSLFAFFVFAGYFVLLQFTAKHLEKRKFAFSVTLGFLFSTFMIFGRNIYTTNSVNISQLKTWVLILALCPIFSSLVMLCFSYLPKINTDCHGLGFKNNLSDKKLFLVVWLLVFVAWLPVLLASYPGVYGYDSIFQINYYRSGNFSLHHPIAHTYLLGFFVITVGEFLGSYEAGMCCYSIFQMLCLSATFSAMYSFYISKRWKNKWRVTILFLFMFLPTNPIMAISATKDVLFAAFFALATMLFLMLAENPNLIKSIRFDIILISVLFLMTVFRNQGKYLIIAALVFALILLWKYKKNILLIIASFLFLLGIYEGPITSALGGIKANSLQEMMSIPCVQLSRAVIYNEDELTDDESRLIKEYISKYDAYEQDAAISDQLKGSLDTERIKSNPLEFVKLWAKVGLKCPSTYVDAFARITVGYWYPDMNYRDPQAYHPYWEYYPTGALIPFDETEYLLLKQTPVKGFELLNECLYDLTYNNSYQSIPLFSMLFSSGMPLWFTLIFLSYFIYKRQYRYLIPLGFVIMMILSLLLGPVVLYRYVYPVCIVVPLLLVSACSIKCEKEVC